MKASESSFCPRCGASVPSGASAQLCPACLLSGALDETLEAAEATVTTGSEGVPMPERSFTRFPCEFGPYRLLGLLGRGGMGAVYEAEHVATGRRVALKMLGRRMDSPEVRQRFLREGRLAARVNHPHSLYVFGSEAVDGQPVITMEIASAGTLKDVLKQRGPLPVSEAVDAMLDVIDGLEAAAAVGVLHRDIKPSNCFVGPDGSVKVGDFGLSVSTLEQTDSFATAHGIILGTPSYASPEQLRGDEVDVRTDVYSVGATLFTLLTNRAPFEGANPVQVVANVMNQKPRPAGHFRPGLPGGLETVIARCLTKEPEGRFADYAALRKALLPFSSREPEPASMKARVLSGWIDYLLALLVPYLILMLWVRGSDFHLRPLVDRDLASAKYYFVFLGFSLLYFTIAEGLWGRGLGKRLRGLRVIRTNGGVPGPGRALIRILTPMLAIESVRIPLLLATIHVPDMNSFRSADILLYNLITNACAWIPVLLTLGARRENRYATVWDRLSGTRVIVEPTGVIRREGQVGVVAEQPPARAGCMGPFAVVNDIVPGEWVQATDPVLRRSIWLWRASDDGPSPARRHVARPGRLRWLQSVHTEDGEWDAFEAPAGTPLTTRLREDGPAPWSRLRHWLHDLASELWAASGDRTLPATSSLDHIWITADGRAMLLERAWPAAGGTAAERIPVQDLAGQQRLLQAVARHTDADRLPLHARPALQNLAEGRFERLSFLAGTLRGLLDRPTEVGRGLRATSLFMLPVYIWLLIFVGCHEAQAGADEGSVWWGALLASTMILLAALAVAQLLEVPFRSTASQSICRLAVVGAGGRKAGRGILLWRWAVVWLPLLLPLAGIRVLTNPAAGAFPLFVFGWLAIWLGAVAWTVVHPGRGLHDLLAGTRVVRQ